MKPQKQFRRQGKKKSPKRVFPRARLKNHFCNLHVPLCGIFCFHYEVMIKERLRS
ncbi:DUF6783 domain-containing protein [Dorea sp.]